MVCGIVGIVGLFAFLGFLPSLAAVIMGHLSARRQPNAKAFWLTGIITGYVGIGLSILTFVLIAIPIIIGLGVVATHGGSSN
jgi:hypothetical protein